MLRLREIYEQVHQTTKQQKDAVSKLQDTDREMKEANLKRQNLTAELQTARQQQELLRQQRRQLAIQSGGKLPAGMSERFDMQYSALEQKAIGLQTQIATLDVEMRSLQPGYKAAKDRVVELSGALPPDLFDEWFWLCDPFGRLPASMHERAVKSLSEWLAENATFAPFHFASGFAHMGLKRYDRAEQDFDRAEELEKLLAGFCSAARGLIHARRGEARQASADFGKALKLKPKPGIVELFLAYGFLAQEKAKDAEKNFKQAAKLNDDSPHAHEALALFLATHRADDSRSVKLAVEQASTAAEQTRWEQWAFLDTLSIALAASGDFEAAAGWSKKALKLAPPDCQVAVQARLALFESGKPYTPKQETR